MLKPVPNWKTLRSALNRFKKQIYLCEECGYPWIAPAAKRPLRCANMACRASANFPKQNRPGRPILDD